VIDPYLTKQSSTERATKNGQFLFPDDSDFDKNSLEPRSQQQLYIDKLKNSVKSTI